MHPNKRKGDRAERAVRDWLLREGWAARRTRAGFDDDLGDVVLTVPGAGLLCLQVKDAGSARWGEWFAQLDDQVATLRDSADLPVLGGVIVWKARGSGDPADWRVLSRLDRFIDLVDLLNLLTEVNDDAVAD